MLPVYTLFLTPSVSIKHSLSWHGHLAYDYRVFFNLNNQSKRPLHLLTFVYLFFSRKPFNRFTVKPFHLLTVFLSTPAIRDTLHEIRDLPYALLPLFQPVRKDSRILFCGGMRRKNAVKIYFPKAFSSKQTWLKKSVSICEICVKKFSVSIRVHLWLNLSSTSDQQPATRYELGQTRSYLHPKSEKNKKIFTIFLLLILQ